MLGQTLVVHKFGSFQTLLTGHPDIHCHKWQSFLLWGHEQQVQVIPAGVHLNKGDEGIKRPKSAGPVLSFPILVSKHLSLTTGIAKETVPTTNNIPYIYIWTIPYQLGDVTYPNRLQRHASTNLPSTNLEEPKIQLAILLDWIELPHSKRITHTILPTFTILYQNNQLNVGE